MTKIAFAQALNSSIVCAWFSPQTGGLPLTYTVRVRLNSHVRA